VLLVYHLQQWKPLVLVSVVLDDSFCFDQSLAGSFDVSADHFIDLWMMLVHFLVQRTQGYLAGLVDVTYKPVQGLGNVEHLMRVHAAHLQFICHLHLSSFYVEIRSH
jgi:uncharacterized oligopeptide transporter (OPT) family protein